MQPANPAISALLLTRYPARAAMLETALVAFRAQTFRDAEVVIVNDGAPLVCALPQARVLNLKRGRHPTLGALRNVGLREARGEWIAVWDDDDISLPTRLAESLQAVDGGAAIYVRSNVMWVADATLRLTALCAGCCYPTALLHRPTALAVGGFGDTNHAEDAVLFERLARARLPLRDFAFQSYVHRRHHANMSSRVFNESLATTLERAVPSSDEDRGRAQALVDELVAAARSSRLVRPSQGR